MIRRTRLKFEEQFTQVPNTWARDRRLSRRARGLLLEITSHRVGWKITIASLQEGGPEGRDAISAGIKELIAAGYLVRSQARAANGRMGEIEYELCDPFATADGKADSGADQAEEPASTDLSTDPTANGFPVSGSAVSGSAVDGESAPIRRPSLEEDQEKKSAAGASTCSAHPNGTTQPCRACRDARTRFEAALAADAQRAAEAAAEARASRYPVDVYCPHLELRSRHCEACAQDARDVLKAHGYQLDRADAA